MGRILVSASLVLAAVVPQARPESGIPLRYVANAGVLLTMGGTSVLVDAPIREGIPPYATSDAAERARLERAEPPYDRVGAILITHWHEDHLGAEAVAAHLSSNGRAVLISSPEVVDRVRAAAPQLAPDRFRAVLPEPGTSQMVRVGALPVRVLRIPHNPTRRYPAQHVGFLVGDAPAVLHVGDADPALDNFALMRDLPPVDLAILPYWYFLSDDNRRLVRETIRPARSVAMHLPPDEAGNARRLFAAAGVRAVLLVEPGTPAVVE